MARIHMNRDQSLFSPLARNHICNGVRSRTMLKQVQLESDLNALAILKQSQLAKSQ